jgi:hypothetical protein
MSINNGILIIGFDTELAWGAIENRLWKIRERNKVYSKVRGKIIDLLRILDLYKIPCTWAFVGKMIDTESLNLRQTDELQAPEEYIINALKNGQRESFFGHDILERVLNSKTDHEIAWHTYYHIRFNSKHIDSQYVERDFQKSKEIGESYNIKFKSLIFPQNIEGYIELLPKYNFRCYRSSPPALNINMCSPFFREIYKGINFISTPPPMSSSTETFPGLRKITGSMFFNPGIKRNHLLWFYKRRVIRGIDEAIKKKACFHIWTHPFNFAEVSLLFESFETILKYASRKRDKGELSIFTMAEYFELLEI